MQTYERETLVEAPLERVWAFHSTIDGLRALTPSWLALRIEHIDRPEQDRRDASTLTAGTKIHASVAPFWMLPRQQWTSVIEDREVGERECRFVDSMYGGPFDTWEHTHRFVADGDRTRVLDHVEYEAPGGTLGTYAIHPVLGLFFAYRHWRTREILHEA